MILFFGIILGVSAKIISGNMRREGSLLDILSNLFLDGAEMLLDLGLPPTIIGNSLYYNLY